MTYHLEQNPQVLLVIHDYPPTNSSPQAGGSEGGLRWLQYLGTAQPLDSPDWSELLPAATATPLLDDLYIVIRVTPERIDLIDESRGWGARETLDL